MICQKSQREVLKFLRVLEQGKELEKSLEKNHLQGSKKSVARVQLAHETTEVLREGLSGAVSRPTN